MLSEERLRQAAHHAAQALEDSLPPPSQCHYDVSPEFRRNMKKLCRQAKRRPYRKVWKAVACARNCMSTSRVTIWRLKRSTLRKRVRMSYLWMLMAWRSQRLWYKVFPATSMLTQWENSPVP